MLAPERIEQPARRLSSAEIEALDAYQLLAALGKRVIHPGGRRSTEEAFRAAGIEAGHRVLEVGCGTGTTAVLIAQRFGAHVTAVDINSMMLEAAHRRVAELGLEDQVSVEREDIQSLSYADNTFDRVIVEAVTMFVDIEKAVREVVRVCKPGGIVVDHEFTWSRQPSPKVRHGFQVEVCQMDFESDEKWEGAYRKAGLEEVKSISGRFVMMTPRGFIRDEGIVNTLRMGGRAMRRWAFIKRMIWNLKRIVPAAPFLGYTVISGTKPLQATVLPANTASTLNGSTT